MGAISLIPFALLLLPASPGSPAQTLPAPRESGEPWRGVEATLGAFADEALRRAERRDDLALAHLARLFNFNQLAERDAVIEPVLRKIVDSRAEPLVRAQAIHRLAELARRRADAPTAAGLIERLDLVAGGLFLGPFRNAGGSGHDAVLDPEVRSSFKERFSLGSQTRQWREIQAGPDGALELSRHSWPEDEASVFFAFGVRVPRTTRAALRTGHTGSLVVVHNGKEIRRIDRRQRAEFEQDATPVILTAGDNWFRMKVSWENGPAALFARITSATGASIDGLRYLSDAAALERARVQARAPRAARHRIVGIADGANRAVARSPKSADAYALRSDLYAVARLYDLRGLPTPPEQDLRRAIELEPSDPLHRFFFAHRVRGHAPSVARAQLDAALICDRTFSPALVELADAAFDARRIVDGIAAIEAAIEADPEFSAAHAKRAQYGFDEIDEGAVAAARLGKAPSIEHSVSAHVELARMHRALQNPRASHKAAQKAFHLDATNPLVQSLLVDSHLRAGDVEEALAVVNQMLELDPWSLRAQLSRVRILAGIKGREQDALAAATEATTLFEQRPDVARVRAELLIEHGRVPEGLEEIDRALRLDAHQPELRRRRRLLSGARDAIEQEYSIDPKPLMGTKVSEEERRWGAVYLADRTAVQLYESGKSTRFHQILLRVQSERFLEALREHQIPYSPSREVVEILTAERIRPSGETTRAASIEDRSPEGKVSGMYLDQRTSVVTFDSIAAGDLIHLRYRIDSVGENIFGGFFGDIQGLQAVLPKRNVLYEARAPKSAPLYAAQTNADPPERLDDDQGHRLRWKFATLAGLELEPFGPPYPEVGIIVSVSTYASWGDLGTWYARLYRDQMELDDATRSAAALAVAGAKTRREKIARLYNHVVKNTRYVGIELGIHGWKPYKAYEVHRRRYGDCKDKSTLLAALLRENGIDASLALVRTSDRGELPREHATMWAFNHAITHVPSEDWYLDPTAEFSGSGELPYLDQGAQALLVTPSGQASHVTLPKTEATGNRNRSKYVAEFAEDGTLTLQGIEHFAGARAANLRREFEVPEQRKRRLERQLTEIFTGISLESVAFSELQALEKPVQYRYRAKVGRYGERRDRQLEFPVALFRHELSNAYAKLAERSSSLNLEYAWQTENAVRYVLPKGARIVKLPAGVEISGPYVSLEQKVTRTADGFETIDTVTIKADSIPHEAYAAFRNRCLQIDRALARKVVVEW